MQEFRSGVLAVVKMEFVDTPDETGKGRVIVDGRYYGVPLVVVEKLKQLEEIQSIVGDNWEQTALQVYTSISGTAENNRTRHIFDQTVGCGTLARLFRTIRKGT